MKELSEKFRPFIRVLVLPYLIIMFILIFPINYYILNPGGITPVENLITVDYNQTKVITGSLSSTYVVDLNRPTFYEFIIGYFSPYSAINKLAGNNLNYSNSEITQVDFLDKATSVDAAILVAYEKAAETNPTDVSVTYVMKTLVHGKAQYLSHYDQIDFGDQFIQIIGDNNQVITDMSQVGANTKDSNSYVFTFEKPDETQYDVTLTKDATTGLFGLYLANYYIIDKDKTFPKYTEGTSFIGGPSGGMMQTLAIYNMLVPQDITHGLKIAGTGTINYDGTVGAIGAVKQKIATAYLNHVDIFFIQDTDVSQAINNYQEALTACTNLGIDPTGWLIPVKTFQDALDYLNGLDS